MIVTVLALAVGARKGWALMRYLSTFVIEVEFPDCGRRYSSAV